MKVSQVFVGLDLGAAALTDRKIQIAQRSKSGLDTGGLFTRLMVWALWACGAPQAWRKEADRDWMNPWQLTGREARAEMTSKVPEILW